MRLAIQFAALIVVLFAILAGVVFAVVSAARSESTARTLIDTSKVDSPHDAPSGVFVAIVGHDGIHTSAGSPPGLPDTAVLQQVARSGHDVQQTKTISGQTYAIRTSADHGRVTQVAVNMREGREELERLGVALIVSGIIAALAAGLIAVWMARRAMRPLADALALQRRFVMDASHELRTPLTLLSTRAQLVRRRLATSGTLEPAGDVADGLYEIVQDARVLSEILEDLLISADPREVVETVSVDLAHCADDAVGTNRADAETRGIVLRRSGTSGPVVVSATRVAMQRLFTALIANALDHASGEVDVGVTLRGREAVIRVLDDGPGFSQGMDERAFERFASSRPAQEEGERPRHYGLGLALVAEVAVRHGGGVSVETRQPGHGAAVLVRLPAHS